MITTPLGKVRITHKGAYSVLTEYSYLDVVTDSGNSYLYINLTPSTGSALSSAEHWDVVAEKGDQGIQGITGDPGTYVGNEEPTNGQTVWFDTDGTPTKLYFKDKAIQTTDWVADTTYAEFPFKADIPCTGVTSAMYASLAFAYAEATSGDYAPVCDTGTDIVTVYAAAVPAGAITVPLVEVLAI